MARLVYLMCSILSVGCTVFLFRGYLQRGTRLLLWSALSFGIFALNNIFLFVDLAVFPDLDFNGPFWRAFFSAASGSLLLFGLIWEIK